MPRFGEAHKLLSPTHPDTSPPAAGADPDDGQVATWSAALRKWTAQDPAAGGVTDHGLLSGLSDHDHPHYARHAADEVITGAWRIPETTSLRFGHDAGPTLAGPASGSVLTLTGDGKVSGVLAVKGATPDADKWVKASPSYPSFWRGVGVEVSPLTPAINADFGTFYAVDGAPNVTIPVNGYYCNVGGLRFLAGVSQGEGATQISLSALDVRGNTMFFAGDLPQLYTALLGSPGAFGLTGAIGHVLGLDIGNMAPTNKIVDATSLRIANQATINTGFNRLIEVGPATPFMRLEGGLAPTGEDSLFILNFGGTLYRLIRDAATGVVETAAI